MQALDSQLPANAAQELDRVFVDLAGDTSNSTGQSWLGDFATQIRYLSADKDLKDELARRFSLRLYPSTNGEPWHADAFLLAQRQNDGRWRATIHHGRLPMHAIENALLDGAH
jgi:hypothetical protein